MHLTDIPGVGEKIAKILTSHDLDTVEKLLTYYPRTYREYVPRTTKTIQPGEWVTLMGTLTRPVSRHTGRVSTQVSSFKDTDGTLTIRWFNSPFITRSVNPTNFYQIRGRIEVFAGRYQIVNPELKLTTNYQLPTTELVPIYTPVGTLKSGHLRNLIRSALKFANTVVDQLDLDIQAKFNLLDLPTTLSQIHFPPTTAGLEDAIHRLGFDELYALQKQALHNIELTKVKTTPLHYPTESLTHWLAGLPFTPTPSQAASIKEITSDLSRGTAMHRLLQGEVGSGKTLVAAAVALATSSAGKRTLLLAPTQILAEQLHSSFSQLLPNQSISLITQSHPGDTEAQIIIGTQALLSAKYHFDNVGLLIVDEQHRFGVEQRNLLTQFSPVPHFLQMTATPIPRTLALSLFAHLDISRLTELPPGRLPTKTFFVPQIKRSSAYSWVAKEIQAGNQAFIVVPVIERAIDNEANPRQSVIALELELSKLFPHLTLDILHGKLKKDDISTRLRAFRDGITQVLVATSMVEVGIDIPGANLIVIEDAERFGLSQLHQLRGRVGRGGKQGYCLVMTNNNTPRVKERLTYFVTHHDGDKLAQYDLAHRGPGELFGTLQHGLINLRFADLTDESLLRDTALAAKISSI